MTPTILLAQDEPTGLSRITSFPTRFLDKVQKQSAAMEEKIIADSEKALKKLAKQEARMKKKLARKDSLKAEQVFGNVEEKYAALQRKLEEPAELTKKGGQYIPQLDSLKTSLKFLSSTKDLLPENPALTGKIQDALGSVNGMQGKLQQAEQIKKILRDRRQQLKEQLSNLGMMKELKKYNQQAYYYGQQLQEYKNMLEDPGKLTEKALGLIQKLPAFQDFFKKNSELAGLFRLPDNSGTPQSLAGLQTRASVQSLIQDRIAAGGPNAQAMLQQNLQAAQSQLSQLKDKLNDLGGAGADGDMPDFKPNTQKTKSFLKRLEYGTNVQSAKSTSFFPTTTDIGLSVGYKLSDKSIIGVGASYKVGWGSDIRNISMSSEGVGLRSFLDVKLKGSFFASGGFEYNYQQPFNSIGQIKALDGWQQSGLLGISKIVSLKSKTFKKTRLQLFWDFLSYQQLPQTQAIKFRVGYNF
ncbi:MAG: hypothetical protein P0Y53_04510 [Candidatus Pseudobacter hemicellulosilyticus]|uniref:Uncharacterized protein n=1 Tax=Candidatus Pseudobacter hemicellulosilyticus TaxID=3121375 RepID=A0AAJ6BIY8_9BACT|nr:MAG: hypothetical protein P0Y53_04510 [Pseudobacter sp.]